MFNVLYGWFLEFTNPALDLKIFFFKKKLSTEYTVNFFFHFSDYAEFSWGEVSVILHY